MRELVTYTVPSLATVISLQRFDLPGNGDAYLAVTCRQIETLKVTARLRNLGQDAPTRGIIRADP